MPPTSAARDTRAPSADAGDAILTDLTPTQREAVAHRGGPLLIIAGAGTGKTTVITRRIAWLLAAKHAAPEELLALTFTEKASAEMEERVDLLVPYGYVDVAIRTFHAFGDQLLREHAAAAGLSPQFRVLSKAEQLVFLRRHVFDLPLEQLRPANDPTRFVEALATVFSRAKDEAVSPEEFQRAAEAMTGPEGARYREIAAAYAAYQRLLRGADAADFGDQVGLAITLLESHPEIAQAVRRRFRHVLVDEFQDTNYAQFRLLQLLTHEGDVTVVADDDQSIYKWRGAALSNVIKFLESYRGVTTVVLRENFRSTQPILDSAYRAIRFNDPDRLEVRQGIDKRLVACRAPHGQEPQFHLFDTVSSEADWVARTIREGVAAGRRPSDYAILVRSNREADLFLRALNVAGVPWRFSGASGLFAREESKMLLSCLKTLADPDDSLSWFHVASSVLYACPMRDLTAAIAVARRSHRSLREVIEGAKADPEAAVPLSPEGLQTLEQLVQDVGRLLELSRAHSAGQVLYRWLSDRGVLASLTRAEQGGESHGRLQTIARFFDQLRRLEDLGAGTLAELMRHLELFRALGEESPDDEDPWSDRVQVLTIHKAKGLEFPIVFLVGLVQGRFPTPQRRDPIELPEALIRDLLPAGDYHLQEERRLFYVGMTRARDEVHLTCAYDYGGKTVRKVSQFVVEALNLATPSPAARSATARELIERAAIREPLAAAPGSRPRAVLRLDAHGLDDYRTCPLKYRYSHVLRLPVMNHHLVVYGAALHKAVEAYFKRQLDGVPMEEAEVLKVFEAAWRSEGFLTRAHEEQRLAQGRETLKRFVAAQQAAPERPTWIERRFAVRAKGLLVVGRWDRVDLEGDVPVIIDYKSTDVHEQQAADRRARESLQLRVYAWAWHRLHGTLPSRVELRFLESGLIGKAVFDEEDLEETEGLLYEAAEGIRARSFKATPQEHACRWCTFQAICPDAFRVS